MKRAKGAENNDVKQSTPSKAVDPRETCCWNGKYFFDALKAIITRMLFALHAMLAIWQVRDVHL